MTLPRIKPSALEPRIRQIGREIFQRAESAAPSLFSTEYWQQSAMNWMTRSPELKLRLFRFIEVLPSLRDAAAIARHLREYLDASADAHDLNGRPGLPGALDLALGFRREDSAYAALVAGLTRFACGRSARYFISGSTPAEALASVRALRRRGMAFTLDVLGETILADRIARRNQQLYIDLFNHLGREARAWPDDPILDRAPWGRLPKVNISIKLSAIVAKFDPIDPEAATAAVLDRLRPILRAARDMGAFVNIDMEHYAVKDLTLDIYKRVLSEAEFRGFDGCGIVIQCYMPEGERDMRELIDWSRRRRVPTTVRLVKGAYWDSETAAAVRNGWPIPLYTEKWESDAAFERVGRMMLENADIIQPAFASHNVRSIAAVLATEEALGLPPRTLELQMLTGMGDQLKRAIVAMGQRLRVYAPFGDLVTGMAYLIRRLIENTSNESFLRQSFGEQLPVDVLLGEPRTVATAHQSSREASDEYETTPGAVVGNAHPTGFDHIETTPGAVVGNAHPTSAIPKPFAQDPDEYNEMYPFENEPDVDFSRPENRRAMHDALAAVREQFGRRYPAIIRGERFETSLWFDSVNPSNPREVVGRTALCDRAIADRAVQAARAALDGWSATTAEERAEVLDRAAAILRSRRFEIAAWMVYEVGKTWREAQGDIMETADYLRFYAHEMRRLAARPRRRDYPGEMNEYVYAPRGVVLVLSPFCFPTALLVGPVAAALVAGNTVIMKPASHAGVCGAKMFEILAEAGLPFASAAADGAGLLLSSPAADVDGRPPASPAANVDGRPPASSAADVYGTSSAATCGGMGLPPGVLNFVPGRGEEIGDYLAAHPGVDMIAFTGSRDVGGRIIGHARTVQPGRKSFKHVVAEMGGKNAIIIDDDADLDGAVQATIASAFGYSGQKCTACSRVIVLRAAYDDYLAKLTEAAAAIAPAPADQPGTTVGPLIDAEAVARCRRYVEIGKEEARCVLEGRPVSERRNVEPLTFAGAKVNGRPSERRNVETKDAGGAFFMGPSIFADVPPDSRLAQEEILGPVLAVMPAESFDRAIELANATPYALVGGVYSRSPRNIEAARRRLRVGMLYVNRKITLSRVDRQPFGGFDGSGLGTKTGGPDYLSQFMLPKTISENTMRHGFSPGTAGAEASAVEATRR